MLQGIRHYNSMRVFMIALLVGAALPLVTGWIVAQAGDDLPEWRGTVDSMPTGESNTWVIGGRTFNTNGQTEVNEEEGELAVGVCVKVMYQGDIAREIDSEPAGDCNGGQDDGNGGKDDAGDQPGGNDDGQKGDDQSQDGNGDDDEQKGDDQSQDDGADLATDKLYGIIDAFPDGFIGTWTIGGKPFIAGPGTEFEEDHVLFKKGVTVKVKFFTDDNDVNHATEIESEYESDDGNDNDKNGFRDGIEGHAYGIIKTMPQGAPPQTGEWTISGIVYQVISSTELEAGNGPFKVEAQVRVEYHIDASGQRIADEIKTTDDNGDVSEDSHTKLLGFVKEMPAGGKLGTWTIGGANFEVDGSSVLKEEHGQFAKGAYVEVEYSSAANGPFVVHEMETHVPPGAGEHTSVGIITEIDDSLVIASQTYAVRQLKIDDTTYTVAVATQINDELSKLAVGNYAVVNSYVAGAGHVATRITGIVVDSRLFLPVALR